MIDARDLEQLKELGAGRPAPEALVRLYRRAFHEFGAQALWSSRAASDPTVADALAITRSLRVEGDRNARQLAELIEEAEHLEAYTTHAGRRQGHWPSSSQNRQRHA